MPGNNGGSDVVTKREDEPEVEVPGEVDKNNKSLLPPWLKKGLRSTSLITAISERRKMELQTVYGP